MATNNYREKAQDPILGHRRWRRYADAFDRIQQCMRLGYHLEAIALLDSLITDRLTSRIGHLQQGPAQAKALGPLCTTLLGRGESPSDKGIEDDVRFRATIGKIRQWATERNEAMHAAGKILRSADPTMSFSEALTIHHQTALDGVALLQEFDLLDVEDRRPTGRIPASAPHAFFPELRAAACAADRRPAPEFAAPERAEDDIDQAKLRELLTAAIEGLYKDDPWLIANGLREEALVFRIAHRLANMVERPGRNIHVDLEYNRQNDHNEPSDPKRNHQDELVTPDLIVHTRGSNTANLLVVEAKRHIPRGEELEKQLQKLSVYADRLGYTHQVLLVLDTVPKWWWVSEEDGFTDICIRTDPRMVGPDVQ